MSKNNEKILGSDQMLKYFERLILPVGEKRFIDDYLEGSGNELGLKFWSVNSSSRLAFDLYSWIIKEKSKVVEFQFEKKLPGVICTKSGPAGVPNMDVFFETKDDMVYIESKYLEAASLAYKGGSKPNLSKAYWDDNKHGNLTLAQRFYGCEEIAKQFSDFCETIQEKIDGIDKLKYKQHSCSGIKKQLLPETLNRKNKGYIDHASDSSGDRVDEQQFGEHTVAPLFIIARL